MFLQSVRAGQNKWWMWLVTLVFVVLGYGLGQVPLSMFMMNVVRGANGGELNWAEVETLARTMDFSAYPVSMNVVVALLLLMFVFATLGLWLGVTKLHGRHFRTLITPFSRVNWRKVFFSFGLWLGFSAVLELISFLVFPDNYVFQLKAFEFFVLVVVSLTLLPIQTSFEELFMRGYLMQGISLWSVYRWIPLLITSCLFGFMHVLNPEVREFGLGIMMCYYIGVGLFLGIITLMDDSLELALGVHAATNIFAALFVTFDSSALQTPAMFRMEEVKVTFMLIAFFVAALVFVLICARKYGWQDWGKIYGKVVRPSTAVVDESV